MSADRPLGSLGLRLADPRAPHGTHADLPPTEWPDNPASAAAPTGWTRFASSVALIRPSAATASSSTRTRRRRGDIRAQTRGSPRRPSGCTRSHRIRGFLGSTLTTEPRPLHRRWTGRRPAEGPPVWSCPQASIRRRGAGGCWPSHRPSAVLDNSAMLTPSGSMRPRPIERTAMSWPSACFRRAPTVACSRGIAGTGRSRTSAWPCGG